MFQRIASVLALICSLGACVHTVDSACMRLEITPTFTRGTEIILTAPTAELAPALTESVSLAARSTPTWVKWGLVGAAAGAVALPLVAPLASDSPQRPARDAVAGAAIGFVVVGGSVALWQAICGPDSASRRAGLCGR